MASAFQIVQGQTGLIDAPTALLNTGWLTDGVYANHSGCNAGTMVCVQDFGLIIARAYVFTYTIDQYTSGGVRLFAGTTAGAYLSANGTNTQELVMAGNIYLSFFSDGTLRIGSLSFYDSLTGVQAGRTISFHEKMNKWVSEKSHQPEVYVRFIKKLFTFNQGSLWLENSNPIPNNFFGVQYSSQVVFIFNNDYKNNKLWYNLRLDSTGKWYVVSMISPPNDQFPNGMMTQMTAQNMKSIDGKTWADVLRDMTDPNFYQIPATGLRAAVALFQGRVMQGSWVVVTLQNDDIAPATLASAEAFYIDVEKSLRP